MFSCFTLAQQTEDQRRLQAYADEIHFNIQLMQGKVSFEELIKQDRLSRIQLEWYQKGDADRLGITKNISSVNIDEIHTKNKITQPIIGNDVYFYEEATPKYFIPYDSKIEVSSSGKQFSVKDIVESASLAKYFQGGTHYEEFINVDIRDYYAYSYRIPTSDSATQDIAITINVALPDGTGRIENLNPALAKNIRNISIFPIGYNKKKIPALRTGQTATRQGLWKADLSKGQTEQVTQPSEVFLQVGEPIPSLGLSEKDEKKIKWTWIDNGVEFLKAQKK